MESGRIGDGKKKQKKPTNHNAPKNKPGHVVRSRGRLAGLETTGVLKKVFGFFVVNVFMFYGL